MAHSREVEKATKTRTWTTNSRIISCWKLFDYVADLLKLYTSYFLKSKQAKFQTSTSWSLETMFECLAKYPKIWLQSSTLKSFLLAHLDVYHIESSSKRLVYDDFLVYSEELHNVIFVYFCSQRLLSFYLRNFPKVHISFILIFE